MEKLVEMEPASSSDTLIGYSLKWGSVGLLLIGLTKISLTKSGFNQSNCLLLLPACEEGGMEGMSHQSP
jgi:hypothetical protein